MAAMGSTFLAFNDASFAAARQPAAALPVQRHLSRRERSSPRSGPGEGSARGTKGSAGSAAEAVTPHPDGYRRLDLSLRERWARAKSPRAFPPRRRSSRCQRAGGAGRQGPALNFYRMPVSWRPARRFLTKVLRDLSAVGSPHRTLALPEVSAQARSDASGHLPIRFQPSRAAPP